MRKLLATAVLILIAASVSVAGCLCQHAGPHETTRDGANIFEYKVEKTPLRYVKGLVLLAHSGPADKALVEIFTHPEYLLDPTDFSKPRPKQLREAACITAKDGRFCFEGLEPGVYEIRVSLAQGINISHVYVEFDPHSSRKDDLVINLSMAT